MLFTCRLIINQIRNNKYFFDKLTQLKITQLIKNNNIPNILILNKHGYYYKGILRMLIFSFKKKDLINNILFINHSLHECNDLLKYRIKLFSQNDVSSKKAKNLLILSDIEK